MKTKRALAIASLALLSTLTSCARANDFVGRYSSKPDGKPELEITQKDGKFFVSIEEGGRWNASEQLSPVPVKDIQELFGQDAQIVQESLGRDAFAIFRVKKGAVIKDLGTLPSDYLVMFVFPRAVYKVH
jgi:hypothetical protein